MLTFTAQVIYLLIGHWIADFVLQTHWQATNKSKNNIALLHHVFTYVIIMSVPSIFILGSMGGPYIAINGILHFITDYYTSRISSKLYAKQDWHNFFVIIGFDQLIHQVTLLTTLWLATA